MVRALVPLVVALVLPFSSSASAQARGGSVPGSVTSAPPQQPATGTGRIQGRIVGLPSGIPLARARVTAIPDGNPKAPLTASTDVTGRYEIANLPAGRYRVVADRAGYLQEGYKRRHRLLPPAAIDVADGATIQQVDISLPKTGVITVRVTDEFGEPVAGVDVQPQQSEWGADGRRRPASGTSPRRYITDDRGETRIHGLPPGEFLLLATLRSIPVSSGAGAVADTSETFAPTYHPGMINLADAEPVVLGVGEERQVQFPLVATGLFRVSGRVVDSRGEPAAGAAITTIVSSANVGAVRKVGVLNPDGTFAVAGFPNGNQGLIFSFSRAPANETATVPIAIQGADIDGLVVTTGVGGTITGQVTFEGARPTTEDPGGELRVQPIYADRDSRVAIAGSSGTPGTQGIIREDGTFSARVILGQHFFFTIFRMSPGWMIKSVMLDGEDITDVPLPARDTISGVRITVTDKLPAVTGRVTNGRGDNVSQYVVVIQAAEERQPLLAARSLRTATADGSGRFQVIGLRPGRYVATAVEFIEQNNQYSPEFQRQLRQTGREFTLGDAQTISIDLRLTEGL
jgi:hypothetical protein